MKQTNYIAAIDPGTSSIRAMVAHKNEGNTLSVLASEQVESGNCVRRGYVYNISETSTKIASLITRLNRKLDAPVAKVYLGIGGQSIHSISYSVKENISDEKIDQDIIDLMLMECKAYQPEGLEVLDIVSPEYLIDGRLEPKPLGVIGQTIEARYQLILGRPSLKSNLEKCIPESSKYTIAGYFVTPLATAEAVLTEEEKLLGCALVEFGAGVTYVSVYKNGSLQLLSTIPLGGNVITKDIQSMKFLEADAETIKTYGSLEGHEIDYPLLDEIISTRSEEIVANVIAQINRVCEINELDAGILITGGGSLLGDIEEALVRDTGITNVRKAYSRRTLVNNLTEVTKEPGNAAIIGLLTLGTVNCAKEKEIIIKAPEPEVPVDLFGEPIVEPPKKEKRKPPKEPKNQDSDPKPDKLKGWINKVAGHLFGDDEMENNNNDKE